MIHQGKFDYVIINVLDGNLTKLDEHVFKPLLSDSTARLDIRGSKIIFTNDLMNWLFFINLDPDFATKI